MRILEPRLKLLELKRENALHVLLLKLLEDNRLVEAVEEFWTERALRLAKELLLEDVKARFGRILRKAERVSFARKVEAEVRRADDDRVTKVDDAALSVGEAPLVQNLEKHVAHVSVRLLELVEEDDRVRTPPHLLGELSALVIADIARRRTDETRGRVLFLEFGHVQRDERLVIAVNLLGQHLRKMRLADARRAKEEERADRTLRIRHQRAAPTERPRDRLHGGVLSDHDLSERLLHPQQLFRRRGVHLLDGDTAH